MRKLSFGPDNFFGMKLDAVFTPPRIASFASIDQPGEDSKSSRLDVLWAAVAAPQTPYADAMRSIMLSVDSDAQAACNVVGLTSYLPAEGKSTVAAGVATLMAQSGRRTLLIDCDVRNPSLSRALTPDSRVGFLEVVTGEATLPQAIRRDSKIQMAFLPTIPNPDLRNATEILASPQARRLIEIAQGPLTIMSSSISRQ